MCGGIAFHFGAEGCRIPFAGVFILDISQKESSSKVELFLAVVCVEFFSTHEIGFG